MQLRLYSRLKDFTLALFFLLFTIHWSFTKRDRYIASSNMTSFSKGRVLKWMNILWNVGFLPVISLIRIWIADSSVESSDCCDPFFFCWCCLSRNLVISLIRKYSLNLPYLCPSNCSKRLIDLDVHIFITFLAYLSV